jgi:hypothetical protein
MAARSGSRGVNGAQDSRKGRKGRVERKFGVVDGLFGETIEVKRSLYFTMAAKTFYVQGEQTTVSTNAIGNVRLDLETGEAVATIDFGTEGPVVTDEMVKQGEAQLEVFRRAVEGLVNRKRVKRASGTREARPQASGENHWRRRKARAEAAAAFTADGVVGVEDAEGPVGEPVDEIDEKFAVRDRVKAKRERDAALKREKRAQARATKGEREPAVGGVHLGVLETLTDTELDELETVLLDSIPSESEPEPDINWDVETGSDEYAQGSEGPVEEEALG